MAKNVKYRNPVLVIIFWFITGGIYGLYWIISTTNELKRLKAKDAPNPMWILWIILSGIFGTILLIVGAITLMFLIGIPIILAGFALYITGTVLSIIYYWKYSKAIDHISKGRYDYVVIFIFWLIFSPVSVVLSQLALNNIAKKKR